MVIPLFKVVLVKHWDFLVWVSRDISVRQIVAHWSEKHMDYDTSWKLKMIMNRLL